MWRAVIVLLMLHVTMSQVKEKDIWTVSGKQLNSFIKKHKDVFVLFTRADCHYCDHALRALDSAANMITTGSPGMTGAVCVHYNVSDHEDQLEHQLDGYPTFRLFVNKTYVDYKGEYQKHDLEKFVETRINVNVLIMTRQTELEYYSSVNNFSILYFYPKPEEKDADGRPVPDLWVPNFKWVARFFIDRRDVTFEHTYYLEEVRAKWSVPEGIEFIAWGDRGKKINFYRGEKDQEKLKEFLDDVTRVYLPRFSEDLYEQLFVRESRNTPTLFFFTVDHLEEDFEGQLNHLAKQFKDRLNFVHALHHEHNNATNRLLHFLGIKNPSFPYIAIYDFKDEQRKYHLPIKAEISKIKVYIEAFSSNQLKPNFKSQEPIQTQPNHDVTQLVGVTYNAFVKNAKTPVLINFYAPWCNVSSTFEPEYTALAKAFWGQVSFASIDASENEVEDVYVPYFPQLKLYRNNQYVHYEGELEREAVAAFLNRKLGTSVEVKKHDDL